MNMAEVNISKEKLDFWLDKKCQAEGCMYLREKGYVYCTLHLHGFPEMLPPEVILYLKQNQK